MSYALEITDTASEDLLALIESLPANRREDAIEGVDVALQKLAANPLLAPRQHLGRPTYRFSFVAGGCNIIGVARLSTPRTRRPFGSRTSTGHPPCDSLVPAWSLSKSAESGAQLQSVSCTPASWPISLNRGSPSGGGG
jgi:hypothetical protein